MILGLGTDIVQVARIQSAVERSGERFLQRILLPAELDYCRAYQMPAPHLAVRFAAKEAVAKAFGTGIGGQLGWLDIEVRRGPGGEPFAVFHGKGLTLFEARGVRQLFLSLSHTEDYATAVAILEA